MRVTRRSSTLGLLIVLMSGAMTGAARARDEHGEEPSVVGFSPARNATGVCIDTPLSITFDRAPRISNSGTISIHRADGSLAYRIDLADPSSFRRTIGGALQGTKPYAFRYYPILINGNTATIYPHQALDYGQTYEVVIDPSVFTDESGARFAGTSAPNTWRFSTKSTGPSAGTTRLTVAADGSGDFSTVQGAIDFVPQNNTQRVFIKVLKGTYNEIVNVPSNKPFLTVYGEDRAQTVIQYANNNNLNPGTRYRMLFGVDAPDFTLATITLFNTTHYMGSQSETFRSYGQRVVLDRVSLKSYQDTLLFAQGTAFVTDSDIEGDIDFMWGTASAYFRNCELRAVSSLCFYTQIRNPQGSPGFVFVNCRLTCSDESLAGAYLTRVDPNVYPYSQVVFITCAMGPHIHPVGWQINNATAAPHVQFWEFRSTDLKGQPLDVGHRAPFSRQLTPEEAAQWSDPAFVLRGWAPDLKSLLPHNE